MTTKEKIIEAIGEIPEEKLTELLKMVEAFRGKNSSGEDAGRWDRFFGIVSKEQAERMKKVIEEEFERIDEDA